MRFRVIVAACLALASAPVSAQQARLIDRGSYRLFVNGERVGREDFEIRWVPAAGGSTTVASATITLGNRQLKPALTTDSAGRPISYAIEVQTAGHVDMSLKADAAGGRFITRSRTSAGQRDQEQRLVPGTLIFDDDVVHQLYFIAQARAAGRVMVYSPRGAARDNISIAVRGEEQVETGNGTVPSTHLILTNAAGAVTDLWVDSAGRVLRVSIPSRRFEAVREEPPR